jgi:DNA topoisomerase II
MLEFFKIRLAFYYDRKKHLLEQLGADFCKVDNKVRFILAVVRNEMIINNRKKSELLAELREEGYEAFPPKAKSDGHQNGGEEEEEESLKKSSKDFDYLLSMPLWNLTMEKVNKLKSERDEKQRQVRELEATPPENIW